MLTEHFKELQGFGDNINRSSCNKTTVDLVFESAETTCILSKLLLRMFADIVQEYEVHVVLANLNIRVER